MKDTDNIHQLTPPNNMNVSQALGYAQREKWNDVMIIGYDDNECFALTSSHMKKSDALYLLKLAEMHIMGLK